MVPHGPYGPFYEIAQNASPMVHTMLRVCHNSAPVVLPSGILGGPRSSMGPMGNFIKITQTASSPADYILQC